MQEVDKYEKDGGNPGQLITRKPILFTKVKLFKVEGIRSRSTCNAIGNHGNGSL